MRFDHRTLSAILLAACWTTIAAPAHAEDASITATPAIIPMPASLEMDGGRFHPGKTVHVAITGKLANRRAIATLANDVLREAWHRPIAVASAKGSADLRLILAHDASANPESYSLRIARDGIVIRAPSDTGLFYGLQTLRQIATPGSDASAGIPTLHITDQPRFHYRGLMLDSARHMQPIAAIKQQLDLMARYKFNTFHWHLTDDQGWRIEIKRFPKLASISSMRKGTVIGNADDGATARDGIPYGGYYTQAQAREIVAYARARHIDVIPEIDMPGHMVAALAAYPELACTPGPFEVYTTWGVSDDILCPSPQTFAFVEGVLDEVMAIFPSHYIHVGGDEAPTTRWKQSALAQDIIRREGLKDEHALQGWFLRRIEGFVRAHGRTIIGWDEILDGGASPTATVMSWRGMQGGIDATRLGHDVVMSPTSHVYLDYCQSKAPGEPLCIPNYLLLRTVYDFEPVPDGLTTEQAAHILGGQGNLWTEYVKTTQDVQYMLFPRSFALAEVLWSPKQAHDWNSFLRRVPAQFAELDRLHVNYRPLDTDGERIARWQRLGYGMFVHWGLYSELGGVWQGKPVAKGYSEQIQGWANIPTNDYLKVASRFSAPKFDADAICKLAKDGGARYIVVTSKHHDGFAMFDTKSTDYNVVKRTPFAKDPLKLLSTACRKIGVGFGVYFSLVDWNAGHAPEVQKNSNPIPPGMEPLIEQQLTELMSNYGPISEVWFDMAAPTPEQSRKFAAIVRKLQPLAAINGRIWNNRGDFVTLGDNELPPETMQPPFEVPASIYHATWGYRSWQQRDDPRGKIRELANGLIQTRAAGGNYLLNIGPKGDGSVVPFEADVMHGIGAWLQRHPGLFDAKPSGLQQQPWGATLLRDRTLYLVVHDWRGGSLRVAGLVNDPASVHIDGGASLPWHRDGSDVVIDLPASAPDAVLPVLQVALSSPLQVIPVHVVIANVDGGYRIAADAWQPRTSFSFGSGYETQATTKVAMNAAIASPRAQEIMLRFAKVHARTDRSYRITVSGQSLDIPGEQLASRAIGPFVLPASPAAAIEIRLAQPAYPAEDIELTFDSLEISHQLQ